MTRGIDIPDQGQLSEIRQAAQAKAQEAIQTEVVSETEEKAILAELNKLGAELVELQADMEQLSQHDSAIQEATREVLVQSTLAVRRTALSQEAVKQIRSIQSSGVKEATKIEKQRVLEQAFHKIHLDEKGEKYSEAAIVRAIDALTQAKSAEVKAIVDIKAELLDERTILARLEAHADTLNEHWGLGRVRR